MNPEYIEAMLDGFGIVEDLANGEPGSYWEDAEACFMAASWSLLYDLGGE